MARCKNPSEEAQWVVDDNKAKARVLGLKKRQKELG